MDMTPLPRTILVAGGAGFIGSHLCAALLEEGHRVIALDSYQTGTRHNVAGLLGHRNFRLIDGEVETLPPISGRIDRIYNLASPASPPAYQADPVRTMMTNVVGTNNLLALAEAKGARLLQASTSEVYGDPEVHPQPEGYTGHVSCTGPRACYDEGKRAAEALCYDYLRAGRTDVRVARIFNTYGPNMQCDDGRIVSNLICQALSDEPMTIYGTGQQTRSFCYVADMVAGLMALMEVPETPDAPVNIGNPGEFTILDLAELIRSMVPTSAHPVFRPLPKDDPQRRRPDISRAKALLGWEPRVPLEQGLKETIPYFAEALQRPAIAAAGGGAEAAAEVRP
ncbi:dTDP-glucose 4,6-dehydratase protein [Oceanicola granulosus HTCC2516]|uniref:dTDP-glucose 4,6-dehydratase protein n=1 Tax=Oceanicola granulosus (strain ATCC BAA-861 / DSM 15982 / KCTC 12143 / HTCC2516) TaxID=314256 RepID=Q2CJL7_OCEGH|nr:UDP-glucuronic acid decarboxylase family protein [Oceanicola granulosus]EAR53122.1 dTDP-glucose 4,6-dehydratase protein [Oceanicola granulosus HTCC2516]